MTRAFAFSLPLAATILAACGGATKDLPPHGEVLVAVDTDLPVPTLAARLRVDLYSEDGRWFESRDIGRGDPRDWPATFSVFSDDDTKEKRVLVRLRVYPEGITRDYHGERFEARPEFREPPSAHSIAELCADPPELGFGSRITLRAGTTPVTDIVKSLGCSTSAKGGAVAATVNVATKGRYRFYVADLSPYGAYVSLSLRKQSCADASAQVMCQEEPFHAGSVYTPGHFPRFDVELDPGPYFLVATTIDTPSPVDVTLEGMAIDAPLPPRDPLTAENRPDPELPRLARDDGRDETPALEPLPSASIDRLLSVRLLPGSRRSTRVTLTGACAGTMARLGREPTHPDLSTAQTCIDHENARAAVPEAVLEEGIVRPTGSVQGTFGRAAPCESGGREDVACVPGGPFLLGSRLVTLLLGTDGTAVPERIAAVSKFWIDRREVSVARFRAALARGFAFDPEDLNVNDASFPDPTSFAGFDFARWCSWSTTPREREDYPLSCINWRLARAFCRFEGGDLPTEAQWEYAAGTAGRAAPTAYAWGDGEPTCDVAVLGRLATPTDKGFCGVDANGKKVYGPLPVSGSPAADTTPLGIRGLGGNIQEWTLDSGASYAGECWRATSVVDPVCWEEEAPFRVARGGCWVSDGESNANRRQLPAGIVANGIPNVTVPVATVGFRCAYAEAPR
jgi:formylglycine-generating enzyme required for sulfatase activity